jgi:beta-carotene ketolase (CrtO type)
MADQTYDAVIVGGGNKALLLALYLIKYAGMSVGIYERRHEIGGCLCTEEISAPGFRGNPHANIILPWYYAPIYRDFPEFWEYGAQYEQYIVSDGFVFKDKENCLAIYSDKHDPNQEKTCTEIARFSEKDAQTWRKLWDLEQSDAYRRVIIDRIFNPPELMGHESIANRQMEVYPILVEAGLDPDELMLTASALRACRELFESPELQSCILRFSVSSVTDINEPGCGSPMVLGHAATLPTIGFNRGGTHMIAHAAHQLLNQMGCKFHINKHVEKAIIENGKATGIRLSDGSEVKANQLVVSTQAPWQLMFDLIGEEYIPKKTAKRVKLIDRSFGCLMWYSMAVHEAPKYKAEAFNPDIHECMWLGLQPDPDPMHIARECMYEKLRQFPPLEDYASTVWCHSLVDPTYAPPGKHVVQNEQLSPPATTFSEKEWLEIKDRYANELMTIWEDYAPNMTWDNVIGVDANTPYDANRQLNLSPDGTMAGCDRTSYQVGGMRPTPELANYRTPIENLYGTGGAWYPGSNAGAAESYNCFKAIAKDMGLNGPWGAGDALEDPESLVESVKAVRKRVQESATDTDKYRR